jgi:hypothetical protein
VTLTLHLGVIEQPYDNSPKGVTTGDVAEFLEAKYHPMELFFELHQQEVADNLATGFSGALESIMSGAVLEPDQLFLSGTTKIDDAYKKFILEGELESLGIAGIPTKAAIARKSSRFKKGVSSRGRVSLYDTGLYVDSFTSWVEVVDWAARAQAGANAYSGTY